MAKESKNQELIQSDPILRPLYLKGKKSQYEVTSVTNETDDISW